MMFTIASIGSLIGPPISGVIHDKEQGFEVVGVWAGGFTLSVTLLRCD
jgi:MCP family monocarboxylic acid transporter-like MFS transporter 10